MEPTPLARARALTKDIRAQAGRIERERSIPVALAEGLFEAGLFDLLLPSELGGAETPLPELIEIVEQLAFGDASVAWCVNQACVFSTHAAKLPRTAADEIFGPHGVSVVHGPPVDTRAVRVDGGYRVTGRWSFGSGIGHSSWLAGRCDVDGDPGRYLLVFCPKDSAEVLDTWDVPGLAGTGSHDWTVSGVFVPSTHTIGPAAEPWSDHPLYLFPVVPLFAVGFASVALGTSVMMMDLVLDLASEKTPDHDRHPLRDDPHAHEQVGLARAVWSAARHYLHGEVAAIWDDVEHSGLLTMDHRIRLRLCGTHVLREARRVADICWELAGTDGIGRGSELHRRYQDMIVISQHLQARTAHYPLVGRYTLGDTSGLGPLV